MTTITIRNGMLASDEEREPSSDYGFPEGKCNRGTIGAGWMAAGSTGASPIPPVQG